MTTPPTLSPGEAETLVEELAVALEELMDQTCADMGPLWVEATRNARAFLDEHATFTLGFAPSPRFVGLSKGARSRYRELAAWRHAVLWREVTPRVEDEEYREAMRVVYFTRYPDNEPPYAWSQRASDAPGVAAFGSATTLKHRAKEGCWHAVRILRRERLALKQGAWSEELRAELLRAATGSSLRDVLKLEELPEWEGDR